MDACRPSSLRRLTARRLFILLTEADVAPFFGDDWATLDGGDRESMRSIFGYVVKRLANLRQRSPHRFRALSRALLAWLMELARNEAA